MVGNNYLSEIETTRADAGIGVFLKGKEKGGFTYKKNISTAFYADKDARKLKLLKNREKTSVLIINNNDKHQIYKN